MQKPINKMKELGKSKALNGKGIKSIERIKESDLYERLIDVLNVNTKIGVCKQNIYVFSCFS